MLDSDSQRALLGAAPICTFAFRGGLLAPAAELYKLHFSELSKIRIM